MWRPPLAASLSEEQFRLLRDLVREHCGLTFADELRYLLERRLAPRVEALGLAGFGEYHRFLKYDPGRAAELEEAVDLLTTNETYFYREPFQLDAFAREILPACARSLSAARRLRILSAGCSTGEEAYTLAMMVRDSRLFEGWDVEIVGTDISRRCLASACAGAYGEHAFRNAEAAPLRRWFRLRGGKWVVEEAIRRMVRFTRENLLDDGALASVSRLDVLFCRNVMIYFDLPARRRVLRRFHRALREGGWLLLGHSESLLNVTADFEVVHLRSDLVYRKPFRLAAARAVTVEE
jgi:chemotaxis protein methyltransferase CheR